MTDSCPAVWKCANCPITSGINADANEPDNFRYVSSASVTRGIGKECSEAAEGTHRIQRTGSITNKNIVTNKNKLQWLIIEKKYR